ncbi:MAG: helix-turn-helix transcriptional regulator, partial [bacterium]|nr:helix-turn-helix transcriptional regulator [bacterium]
AAKKIGVKLEILKDWEEGKRRPTIRQALTISEKYQRPLSLFYLDTPPTGFKVAMQDFRTLPHIIPDVYSPNLILEQRNALERRDLILELMPNPEAGVFPHIDTVSMDRNPREVAEKVRDLLGIDWKTQQSWKDKNQALNSWKEAVEKLNVLVFHTNHHHRNSVSLEEARGFSVSEKRFPIIVLNS